MNCICDGFPQPVEDCDYCSMTTALVDAAGKQTVREAEQLLKTLASVSISVRRGE
jgi:hypothetical protein